MVKRVRALVQDETPDSYRYSTDSIVDAVNDAVLHMRRVRPELFLSANFQVTDVDPDEIGSTNLPIEDHFSESLTYLAAGELMLRDDEFSQDSRAVHLMNKGIAMLTTVQA